MANAITDASFDFLRWWGGELRGLLPRSLNAPLGSFQRRLVLSAEGNRFRLFAERGSQLDELYSGSGDDAREEALLRLTEATRAKPGTPVVLRFGPEECFSRVVHLPAAAARDFARILELDLERTTPFRRADVLTAHYIDASAPHVPGKRTVRQFVVKRRNVEELTARMRELGVAPASADCWNDARSGGLPVDLLGETATRDPGQAWGTRLPLALAAAAVLTIVSAVAIHAFRHESVLAALRTDVAIARTEAQTVRQELETADAAHRQIAALNRMATERVSVARVLDELSAVLPDAAWVYDLRIDAQTVEFTGFARSAAALIPLLEQSKMFTAASLTSPVVLDGAEDKERFSIRVRLRDAPEPKPGAASPEADKGDM